MPDKYTCPMDDYATAHRIYNLLNDDPSMILILKNAYITDDMWYFCIQRDTSLFKEMKHPSEAMCLFALGEDGRNLKYMVSKFTDIKLTNKMIWTALTSQPAAYCFIPKKIRTLEMKEYAYTRDPSLMENDDDIRPEFLEALIAAHPDYIKYVKSPPNKLICKALEVDPNIIVYFPEVPASVSRFFIEKYPEIAKMMQFSSPEACTSERTDT